MDDMRAIRSLINTLRIPSLDTRVCSMSYLYLYLIDSKFLQEIVLDMFFGLLNIKPPAWHKTFIDGRRLTSRHFPKLLILLAESLQCIEDPEMLQKLT